MSATRERHLMTDSQTSENVALSRIEIVHVMHPDGALNVQVTHSEGQSLISLLGLLEFAKDTLVRSYMGENNGDGS